jgi:hypothetical protein
MLHDSPRESVEKNTKPLVLILDSFTCCRTCRGELNTLKAELSRAKEDSDAMAKQVGQPVQMK